MATPSTRSGIGVPDVAFGLLCVVSVAATLLGQFVSLVVFDSTGLDQYVPSVVIYSLAPALLMTVLPAAVAARRYDRRRALAATVGVFVAALAVSFVTMGFFLIG
ncbi:hypothetical protein [Halomarina oriensis]|uniref:Uncharacterized protein n=1 Tax=Halomarina oriensis TaxID=671145 RepID=A0A6B0GRC4_9EURY|nr:hypothetical protein [Halomarina oriensis]MWG35927.1 hypothetical protein [Halomarina oriensis]